MGDLIFLLNGPSCSSGDFNCSCSEGQCCAITENGCYCNNCDNDGDGDSNDLVDNLIDALIKILIRIIL